MTHRYLPHTADLRVSIRSPTVVALFQEAADVLRELLVGTARVAEQDERHWAVTGTDRSEVLLAYLQELLFAFATEGFVPARVSIDRITAFRAEGRTIGEPFDPDRHEHQPEVKAVTRHGLTVEPEGRGWRAEIVFDV